MIRRVTSLLLVILLFTGFAPIALASEGQSNADTQTNMTEDAYLESLDGQSASVDLPNAETEDSVQAESSPAFLLSAESATVTATMDKSRQIRWIGHSYGRYETDYYDAQGTHQTGYVNAISVHKVDGVMAYCIEPTREFGSTYTENEANAAWMNQLTEDQRYAIALAVAYGYPNIDYPAAEDAGAAADPTLEYPLYTELWQVSEKYVATQIIVWEIVMGKRSSTSPYNCTDSSLLDSFYREKNPYGYRADWNTLKLTYDSIGQKMADHKAIPSFTSINADASPEYFLHYDPSTGMHSVTLTDANGVLDDFSFSFDIPGIDIERSGNSLKITATAAAAAMLSTPSLVKAEGSSLDVDHTKVLIVWEATDGGQTAVQLKYSPDLATAYFNLRAEMFATLTIQKSTNTGQDLSGWRIGVYTDATCTAPVSGSPYITDENGQITINDMPGGTYYLKEEPTDAPHWVIDNEIKAVTLSPGGTETVVFNNIHCGQIRIVKSLDVTEKYAGWEFRITDTEGNIIPGSPFVTQEDGTVLVSGLLPGEYTVEERFPSVSLYYCKSENPQIVTVTAGQTTDVHFTNTLRLGTIHVEKTFSNGNHASGSTFHLEWSTDGIAWSPVFYSADTPVLGATSNAETFEGSLTTGNDGIAEWSGLYPGVKYRLTEVKAPKGQQLMADILFEGELPTDDLTVSISVTDGGVYLLPLTGSVGLGTAASAGSAFAMLAAAAAIKVGYRKKRQ